MSANRILILIFNKTMELFYSAAKQETALFKNGSIINVGVRLAEPGPNNI